MLKIVANDLETGKRLLEGFYSNDHENGNVELAKRHYISGAFELNTPGNKGVLIDKDSIAVQIHRKDMMFHASLNSKNGINGSRVYYNGDQGILIWNEEMMNVSMLLLNKDLNITDIFIDLDNVVWDEMELIQQTFNVVKAKSSV